MSIRIDAVFTGRPPLAKDVNARLKVLDLPARLRAGARSLAKASGVWPIGLKGEEEPAAPELSAAVGRPAMEEALGVEVPERFDAAISFIWGGSEDDMIAAHCVAAALADLLGGMVFDDQAGAWMTPAEALALARRMVADKAMAAPAVRPPGTTPRDIKSYLAPLLAVRPDLALKDRLLYLRPVRHVLRGFFFDRTSDKQRFQIYRLVMPLHAASGPIGHGDRLDWNLGDTRHSRFRSLLLEALEHHVMDVLAPITKLEQAPNDGDFSAWRLIDAAATLRAIGEEAPARALAERMRALFGREEWAAKRLGPVLDEPFETFLEGRRIAEAATAKKLGLGADWTPAPFPIETPEADRARLCDDHRPPADPWPRAATPAITPAPAEPGRVVYSEDDLRLRDVRMPTFPIDEARAIARFAERRSVRRFERRHDGLLSFIGNIGAPREAGLGSPWYGDWFIELQGRAFVGSVSFAADCRRPGAFKSWRASYRARNGDRRANWEAFFERADDKASIWGDRRGDDPTAFHRAQPIGPDHPFRAPTLWEPPAFDDLADLSRRVEAIAAGLDHPELARPS